MPSLLEVKWSDPPRDGVIPVPLDWYPAELISLARKLLPADAYNPMPLRLKKSLFLVLSSLAFPTLSPTHTHLALKDDLT